MESKLWCLVISALVVAAAATTISNLNEDDFDPDDEFDVFDEYDNTNVTEHGGRKGKIRKLHCKHFYC